METPAGSALLGEYVAKHGRFGSWDRFRAKRGRGRAASDTGRTGCLPDVGEVAVSTDWGAGVYAEHV